MSEAGEGGWDIKVPQGLYHQTNDADILRTRDEFCTEGLGETSPARFSTGSVLYHIMYEGRMIHFFDHRAASVGFRSDMGALRTGITIDVTESQKNDPNFLPSSRFMVPQIETERRIPQHYQLNWFCCFKDVTSSTNERTMIAAIIPRLAVVYSIRLVIPARHQFEFGVGLTALFNSFVFDYLCRQKVQGNHITDYILRQIPFPSPSVLHQKPTWFTEIALKDWLVPRVLELSYTSWDLAPFAGDWQP